MENVTRLKKVDLEMVPKLASLAVVEIQRRGARLASAARRPIANLSPTVQAMPPVWFVPARGKLCLPDMPGA